MGVAMYQYHRIPHVRLRPTAASRTELPPPSTIVDRTVPNSHTARAHKASVGGEQSRHTLSRLTRVLSPIFYSHRNHKYDHCHCSTISVLVVRVVCVGCVLAHCNIHVHMRTKFILGCDGARRRLFSPQGHPPRAAPSSPRPVTVEATASTINPQASLGGRGGWGRALASACLSLAGAPEPLGPPRCTYLPVDQGGGGVGAMAMGWPRWARI